MVPGKSVNKIPYEIWTGRKSRLSHLRVWGCPVHVKCLMTDKLGARSNRRVCGAPCEPPVEVGRVCGLWSKIPFIVRDARATVDGLGIGSLGNLTNWGLNHLEISPKGMF